MRRGLAIRLLHHDHVLGRQYLDTQPLRFGSFGIGEQSENREIDLVVLQPLREYRRNALGHTDGDARIFDGHAPNHRRHDDVGEGRRDVRKSRARWRCPARLHVLNEAFEIALDRAGMPDQSLSGLGQPDAPPVPREQFETEPVLDLLDLPAECGLSDV